MTRRAVLLGILAGVFVAGFTHFNDHVVNQTFLTGSLMPVFVFGLLLAIVLGVNPLLASVRPQWVWRPSELAIVVALALAACGWAGSGFYRFFVGLTAMGGYNYTSQPWWHAARLLSYLPGGSPELAEGFVRDWPRLLDAMQTWPTVPTTDPRRQWAELIEPTARARLRDAAITSRDARERLLNAINTAFRVDVTSFDDPSWHALLHRDWPHPLIEQIRRYEHEVDIWRSRVRAEAASTADELRTRQRQVDEVRSVATRHGRDLRRLMLQTLLPDALHDQPPGEGVQLAGGAPPPAVMQPLISGREGNALIGISDVPWNTWWPTIRLWGTVAVLLGIASVCLAVIVHPQWADRELLTFPIVRFVQELTGRPDNAGSNAAPGVLQPGFWVGFLVVAGIHLINGAAEWVHGLPSVPLLFSFTSLTELMPLAGAVPMSYVLFEPQLFFSMIGLAFFLRSDVSLSLGLAGVLWTAFGVVLMSSGVPLLNGYIEAQTGSMLRAGAFIGMALAVLYFGRQYYLQVTLAAVGWRTARVPAAARYAARALAISLALCAVCLNRWAGLDPLLGVLVCMLVLLTALVIARLSAEAGLIFVQPFWLPATVLLVVFDSSSFGPAQWFVLVALSTIMIGDPREHTLPLVLNGLRLVHANQDINPDTNSGANHNIQHQDRRPPGSPHIHRRWLIPLLTLMVIASFVIAGVATLLLQYNFGSTPGQLWPREWLPNMQLHAVVQQIDALSLSGDLASSMQPRTTAELLAAATPDWPKLGWLLVGLSLVLGCYAARLRLPWFALHPAVFLVWGTFGGSAFALSFLLGGLFKQATLWIGGVTGYATFRPFMAGLVAGELIAGIIWMIVGLAYFLWTGQTPSIYAVLPR